MRLGESPVTPPGGAIELYQEAAYYAYDKVLTANQELGNEGITIDADSDFMWLAVHGTQTGNYELRFRYSGNARYESNSRIRNANRVGTAQFPVPVFPRMLCPAGSRLGIDIKDLSGAGNTVQIVLVGMRLYRTAR